MTSILNPLNLTSEGSMERSKAFDRLNEILNQPSDDNQRIVVYYLRGKSTRSFDAIRYENDTRWKFL